MIRSLLNHQVRIIVQIARVVDSIKDILVRSAYHLHGSPIRTVTGRRTILSNDPQSGKGLLYSMYVHDSVSTHTSLGYLLRQHMVLYRNRKSASIKHHLLHTFIPVNVVFKCQTVCISMSDRQFPTLKPIHSRKSPVRKSLA